MAWVLPVYKWGFVVKFTHHVTDMECVLEEFDFCTRPYSNASVDRAGTRISVASKIPPVKSHFTCLVLSIHHSRNYGVKTRKFHGTGKDPLPVPSTKRYFKPWSLRLPYGTIYGNHGLHINPNTLL